MAWQFDSSIPIFKQIIDNITFRIIKGSYKCGEKIDSVRDLAIEAGVNPNTMQRALSEIESIGLIETKRGDGRYITDDAEKISTLRYKYIEDSAIDFINRMKDLEFTTSEIMEIIKNNL